MHDHGNDDNGNDSEDVYYGKEGDMRFNVSLLQTVQPNSSTITTRKQHNIRFIVTNIAIIHLRIVKVGAMCQRALSESWLYVLYRTKSHQIQSELTHS